MSTLHVENLKGLSSGGNANKIIVPSGQTLDASAGTLFPSAGQVIQVQKSDIRTAASTFSTTTLAEVSTSYRVSITPKLASSSYILCNFSYHSIVDDGAQMGVAIYVSTDGGSTFASAMDGGGQTPTVGESHRNNTGGRTSTRSHTSTFYDIYSTTDPLIFTIYANRANGSSTARINDNGGGSFLHCMEIM